MFESLSVNKGSCIVYKYVDTAGGLGKLPDHIIDLLLITDIGPDKHSIGILFHL